MHIYIYDKTFYWKKGSICPDFLYESTVLIFHEKRMFISQPFAIIFISFLRKKEGSEQSYHLFVLFIIAKHFLWICLILNWLFLLSQQPLY